jgi:hypothetical protein
MATTLLSKVNVCRESRPDPSARAVHLPTRSAPKRADPCSLHPDYLTTSRRRGALRVEFTGLFWDVACEGLEEWLPAAAVSRNARRTPMTCDAVD